MNRWGIKSGRRVCFDGNPIATLHREGDFLSIEVDSLTAYLVSCLNRDCLDPEQLYTLLTGEAKPEHLK